MGGRNLECGHDGVAAFAEREFGKVKFGGLLEIGERGFEGLPLGRGAGLRIGGYEPFAIRRRINDGRQRLHDGHAMSGAPAVNHRAGHLAAASVTTRMGSW